MGQLRTRKRGSTWEWSFEGAKINGKRNPPKSEPIANLFTIMKIVSAPETLAYFEEKYNNCEIRYGDMKKQLADDILKVTLPIRERILEIKDNDEYMRKIVAQGAEKARESAAKTLRDVKEIMGIRYF